MTDKLGNRLQEGALSAAKTPTAPPAEVKVVPVSGSQPQANRPKEQS